MSSPARLLIIAGYLTLAACSLWPDRIHPEFVDTFIQVNRHSDDDATGVAFDPIHRVLAVGRESGRLELWDTRKTDVRIILEASSIRVEDIAFGSSDGIVLASGIALTDGEVEEHTRVWDIHTGQLLHEISKALGPATPSPVPGVYVVAHSSDLMLYQHERRALVGERFKIGDGGSTTSIASDPTSGLVAVGTASGTLHLLKLEGSGESMKLSLLREIKPYQIGNWIQAVAFLDGGTRLFSVTRHGGEVAEWNTATLKQVRVLPSTVRDVYWASFTPNEPWLLVAGEMGPDGDRGGKVELVDLRKGVALRFKANTTHPVAVLLPEIEAGIILQHASVKRIRYLDE